jgi:hypothetical protein
MRYAVASASGPLPAGSPDGGNTPIRCSNRSVPKVRTRPTTIPATTAPILLPTCEECDSLKTTSLDNPLKRSRPISTSLLYQPSDSKASKPSHPPSTLHPADPIAPQPRHPASNLVSLPLRLRLIHLDQTVISNRHTRNPGRASIVEPVPRIVLCRRIVRKYLQPVVFPAHTLRPIQMPHHRELARKPLTRNLDRLRPRWSEWTGCALPFRGPITHQPGHLLTVGARSLCLRQSILRSNERQREHQDSRQSSHLHRLSWVEPRTLRQTNQNHMPQFNRASTTLHGLWSLAISTQACHPPKPPNLLTVNDIHVAYQFHPASYT